jgi:hypothetical protein
MVGSANNPRLAPERLVPGKYPGIRGSLQLILRDVPEGNRGRLATPLGVRDLSPLQALA